MNTSRSTRWWDLPNAVLLLAALSVVTARLTATEWVAHLEASQAVNVFALLAGLALGYSRFRPRTVRLLNVVYGSVVILWQLGETRPALHYWAFKLAFLGERWQGILQAIRSGEDILDPLFFLTLTFIVTWSLASTAAYLLVRSGNAWYALTPGGLLLFLVHINDKFWPFRAWYLALYGLLGMLLLARAHYLHNHARWKQRRARLPAYMSVDITRAALLVSIPLLLGAWMLPSLPRVFPQVQETWQEATAPLRERFRPLFASLRATVGVVSDYYGETLTLGLGQPLSEAVVMEVETPADTPAGVRFYWRARTYDRYAENTWESTLTEEAPISDLIFDARPLLEQPRWQAELTFTLRRPFGTLHVVPQPLGVDRPGTAYFARNPDGSLDLGYLSADPLLNPGATYTVQAALTAATIADLRAAGTQYPEWVRQRYLQLPPEITARTRALAQELAAGRQTPYDIAEAVTRYLRGAIEYQTTIDAPPRGQEVVDWLLFDYRKGFCNYYATAEVVLLRSLGIPARLAVGYAQGEYHRIPAEDALQQPGEPEGGQAPPETAAARYTVRQKDLHAWPEVYFPGIGWVEFEPTANQNPILRLSGEPLAEPGATPQAAQTQQAGTEQPPIPTPAPLDNAPPPAASRAPSAALRLALRLGALLLSVLLGYLLTPAGRYALRYRLPWAAREMLHRIGLRPAPEEPPADLPEAPPPLTVLLEERLRLWGLPVPAWLRRRAAWLRLLPEERAYHEINRALRRLGDAPAPSATPAERATRLGALLPDARPPAARLLRVYQALRYAPPAAAPHPAEEAAACQEAARHLRAASWRAWLDRKLARWQE